MTDRHRMLSLREIARHAAPNVALSTIIPTSLFYVGWFSQGKQAAFVFCLAGALTIVALRSARRQRVPAMLVLTTALLVLRTVVGVTTGSTRLYFLQPIAQTVIVGLLFVVSFAAGRPLIQKLAGDFVPLPAEMERRPEIQRLFRNLSILWAGVYFTNATVTLLLLMNMPVATFVATKTVVCLAITWGGLFLTFTSTMRVFRAVGLVGRPHPEPAALPATA